MARKPRVTKTIANSVSAPTTTIGLETLNEVDRCIADPTYQCTPELSAGRAAIQSAFAAYEAGRDDAAREALNSIGLTSPFLDWKMLIRGLLAYVTNDDARALENWLRLKPNGLPFTIVAPLRAKLDRGFLAAQPASVGNQLRERAERLSEQQQLKTLRELQSLLSGDRELNKAWRLLETALPVYREKFPSVVPRLANCLYRAMSFQGNQGDPPKYAKLFGPPMDDPKFDRLNALGYEKDNILDVAFKHWQNYEKWLATNPPGWSPELLTRARAIILLRMGTLIDDQQLDDEEPTPRRRNPFMDFLRAPRSKGKLPKSSIDVLQQAVKLAPNWSPAMCAYLDELAAQEDWKTIEKSAAEYIQHVPNDLPVLSRFARSQQYQQKMVEWLAAEERMLALNPLDRKGLDSVGIAGMAAARQSLLDGELAEAEAILERLWVPHATTFPTSYRTLRSIIARKDGRKDDAAKWETEAFAQEKRSLVAAYYLSIDAQLAKIKPAERKPLDARLTEVFETAIPHPFEVNMLFGGYGVYVRESRAYRGAKTHYTKIVKLAERSVKHDQAEEVDYEVLLGTLYSGGEYKTIAGMVGALQKRFPTNPAFLFFDVQVTMQNKFSYQHERRVLKQLAEIKRLAAESPHAQHKAYIEQAEKIEKELGSPLDMFDFFFNRR